MSRIFNFSAGPATLPQPVLEAVAAEMLDFGGQGMGIMEMSHRDKPFMQVAAEAEADLRTLMNIPANYKVLFLQGGATGHFSFIPMNLLAGKTRADYILTGDWGKKAAKAAKDFCSVNIAATSEETKFTTIPDRAGWRLNPDAAYVHITPNETIHGVEFLDTPDVGNVPLVGDFSSTILSRPVDVSKYGLIYAGAQKNIGPAGLTIVIVREDLIGKVLPGLPPIFNYAEQAANDSMLNTPPTFAWYMAGKVFKHLLAGGGLEAMAAVNQRKAEKLYGYIDREAFYTNQVDKACRSWMNIPFTLADAGQDAAFLQGAKAAGLAGLKGHRAVGGMRASLYNAMPEAGVDALLDYMKEFVRTRG